MLNQETIQALPKVELHCHLDGSIQMATLEKLAKKENLPLAELKKAVAPKKCHDLKEYLASFDVVLPLLQSAENLQLAAYDLVEQAVRDNICYLEIRFAPLLHQKKGLAVPQIIQAVLTGIQAAQKEHEIHVNLLISAMRHHEEAANLELINSIKQLQADAVVGFDFAGDEQQVGNENIKNCTDSALAAGLKLTLHSGECGCPHNVVEAIHLGATRIGHGVAIKDSPDAMVQCKKNQTLLELCPTSNIQTNAISDWSEYPLRFFLKEGINCCINTDNRTVSQTNLVNEYSLLVKHCQLSFAEMKQLNLNAIEGSFAEEKVKQAVIEKIMTSYHN
ncbi:adenosine deaminase [Enterococcus sp. PF1-24]|uniref:adenosine deaminase n=1 Tax=unclassified Enterococcus TaxID=2608891 RepID=UPI0024742AD2|nr:MULTISPECIES: adenosine deaminase [unclassified Enterococcus]MDH6363908.1 adenosine deaminase [Enterococcus sp. PFB1-1]MDH6400906.1 adenosine deaminase [Enterococcus sp. PF1-24]